MKKLREYLFGPAFDPYNPLGAPAIEPPRVRVPLFTCPLGCGFATPNETDWDHHTISRVCLVR